MQLRRQLTASKSANDLSSQEMLIKSLHIKSESLNDMNANVTVKSQKDYSLPPGDISTINNNQLEDSTVEDNAASYQTKSEETLEPKIENKVEVKFNADDLNNVDVVEIKDEDEDEGFERMETKTILRKHQSYQVSPNPHTSKVDSFIKGFAEGNSNSAKTLKLRKSVQIAEKEKPKKRLISVKTVDVDGEGKDSK